MGRVDVVQYFFCLSQLGWEAKSERGGKKRKKKNKGKERIQREQGKRKRESERAGGRTDGRTVALFSWDDPGWRPH
jgi:hypothetical protein